MNLIPLETGDEGGGEREISISPYAAKLMELETTAAVRRFAEAEVRMTLKNQDGEMLWQKSCFGEIEEKKYLTATAREDQKLVDAHLTKAVKRANACLLGQMRQYLLESASAPE